MNEIKVIADRFEITGFIGEGGMGTVYRGVDRQSGQPVAIKSLKPEVVRIDTDLIARFEREGEALRKLNHPNIVKMLHTAKGQDGGHYIVMEYVGGGSLRDLLDDLPKMPVERALQIALDLADALTRAHRLNIIHRDIKPANILIADDGTPRLTDFGVAQMGDAPRVTQAGSLVGTLAYLSPEGANGEDVDARADIWAFGVMLFEMLAGHTPFDRSQIGATLQAILTSPTPDLQELRPDVPDALADLIYRMLVKDRSARIPSVRLVGAELEAIIQGTDTSSFQRPIIIDSSRFSTPTPAPAADTSTVKPPHNLPAQTTPFVGREEEVAELIRLLRDPNVRLVTIAGPGGMGKTRLSQEVAQQLLDGWGDLPGRPYSTTSSSSGSVGAIHETPLRNNVLFPNGVFFVPLAPIDSPDLIVSTIAEHINFTFYSGDDPKTQLADYLREKSLLLLIDNFEHVIAGAGIVGDLLKAAPGVKVLVTSRERLRLQGETIFDLQGMQFPEYETPKELENYAAVKLFLQSARRVVPDFELNGETAPLVARISRLVQGLPLGIELAAAWLEALSAHEIVQEMERSFDFLETDLRDVPERHRSLRAVFEYSWALMTEAERAVYVKLSVFRGGFTREAAQTVSDASLRDLTNLVNKSLLRRTPEGRYEIHELLRQYADGVLKSAPPEHQESHRRHCAYYANFLHSLEKDLFGRNQRKMLDAVEAEFDNVRAAWHCAADHGELDSIDKMVVTLAYTYDPLSLFKEGEAMFKHALDRLEQRHLPDDSLTLARVRLFYGSLTGRLGNYQVNRTTAQQAYEVFRRHHAKSDMLFALNNLAYVEIIFGDYAGSKAYAREAVTLSQELGDQGRIFLSQGNLGYAHFLAGEYEEAKRIYVETTRAMDEADIPIGRAYSRNNLGEIVQALGDYEEAKRLFQEANDIFRQLGNRRGIAFTLNNLGNIASRLSQYDEAVKYFEESLALYRDTGDRSGIANALQNIGYVEWMMHDYPKARGYFEESYAIRKDIGDKKGMADSLINLANCYDSSGEAGEAIRVYEESLAISREIQYKAGIASSLQHLGNIRWYTGDYPQARQYLEEALTLHRDIGDPFELGLVLSSLAQTLNFLGEFRAAIPYAEEALKLHEQLHVAYRTFAHIGLGHAYFGLGELDKARHHLIYALDGADQVPLVATVASLTITAALLAAVGKVEAAVEIITFRENYPDYEQLPQVINQRIENEMAQIRARIGESAFAAAQARGKSRTMEDILALARQALA